MMIRDTLVPEEYREEHYRNLKLSSVIEKIVAGGGMYSYCYRLHDTPEMRWREVVFNRCIPGGDDVLVTVRDVHDEVMAEKAKRAEETMLRNKERQTILSGLGFDIIVDHDLISGEVEVLGEVENILKRQLIREDFPQGEIDAGMVHPDDLVKIVNPYELRTMDNTFSTEFRLKRGDGKYFWCLNRGVVLSDENGKPYRCVSKLTDIDAQKRSEQKLIYEAQRDLLTGLYNNITTQRLIEDYLLSAGADLRHALLVIDIDNLKEVNDSFGHKAGDKLIRSLAGMLKSSFRSSDIIGRVGGDEFVVFLKNIESEGDVVENVRAMKARIKSISIDEKAMTLSPMFSTGISFYPEHGKTYNAIFRHADSAMYYIKGHGKNGIKLYDKTVNNI